MEIRELGYSEWENALPDDEYSVFHTPAALSVLDKHGTGELRLLGGFNGEQAVGLLPVVVRERAGVRFVLSPPPGFGIRDMGPLVMPSSPKQRKRERVNRSFVEEALSKLEPDSSLSLLRFVCLPEYSDPRPYEWNDFEIEPAFTYRIDLESRSPAEVIESFSRSLRREIRDLEDDHLTIRTGGRRDARNVYEATKSRFEEQDIDIPLPWPFVRDLFTALGNRASVYVAESEDGEFLSGIIVLYSNDTAYFWKGGGRRSHDNRSVNSLLHWRAITDALEEERRESIDQYDLHGASNERLSRYKSKFGGDLVASYRIESAGLPMTLAKKAYRTVAFGEEILYWDGRPDRSSLPWNSA